MIVGICLIKNEDIFISQVIKNILDFCDKILILDNFSTDNTMDIITDLAKKYNHIIVDRIKDVRYAISYVQEYIGKNIWLFSVDGDEIYDPNGLKILRSKMLSGRYNKYWQLRGYFFHVCWLNEKKTKAHGWFAPPSKEVTKLKNMALLKDWKPDGVTALFHPKPIFAMEDILLTKLFYKKKSWDKCILRCFHTRFLKRSSIEKDKIDAVKGNPRYYGIRLNPSDKFAGKLIKNIEKIGYIKGYRQKYRVGGKHSLDARVFFEG